MYVVNSILENLNKKAVKCVANEYFKEYKDYKTEDILAIRKYKGFSYYIFETHAMEYFKSIWAQLNEETQTMIHILGTNEMLWKLGECKTPDQLNVISSLYSAYDLIGEGGDI